MTKKEPKVVAAFRYDTNPESMKMIDEGSCHHGLDGWSHGVDRHSFAMGWAVKHHGPPPSYPNQKLHRQAKTLSRLMPKPEYE